MKHTNYRALAIIITLIFTVAALSGCIVINNGGSSDYSDEYENSSRYASADGEVKIDSRVKRLYIYWVSGDVTVKTHSGNDILLSETASSPLEERVRMHYYFDGETLFVRFAAAGRFRLGILGKSLTVGIPAGAEIDEIKINVTSANVNADGIAADEIDFETVSGDINFSSVSASESLHIDTVSGKVDGTAVGRTEDVNIDTVSGRVTLSVEAADSIDIDTTSGNVEVSAASVPSKAEFDSVSGALTLLLPDGAGFDARLKTVSGNISSDFATQISGSHYICGGGALKIDADTVSGDIYIRKNGR